MLFILKNGRRLPPVPDVLNNTRPASDSVTSIIIYGYKRKFDGLNFEITGKKTVRRKIGNFRKPKGFKIGTLGPGKMAPGNIFLNYTPYPTAGSIYQSLLSGNGKGSVSKVIRIRRAESLFPPTVTDTILKTETIIYRLPEIYYIIIINS